MPKIDFHFDLGESDHDPYEFVDAVMFAEQLGLSTAWFGDHFAPWGHSGNRSAFVWPVISVALEKTQKIRLGPMVSTPIGGRYHPALVAQACATIDNMYPGRFALGVGTGEAINERPFLNDRWSAWQERIERLTEGVALIRQLWHNTEPFEFKGKYFSSDFFYLYTKPKTRISIYFSGIGKKAAYAAGKFGDHLVTLNLETKSRKLSEDIIPAFRKGCRDANKKVGEIVVGINLTTKEPQELWASSRKAFGYALRDSWSIETPVEVDRQADEMTVSDLMNVAHFCKDWNDAIKVIEDYRRIGATAIILGTGLDKTLMKEYADNLLAVF